LSLNSLSDNDAIFARVGDEVLVKYSIVKIDSSSIDRLMLRAAEQSHHNFLYHRGHRVKMRAQRFWYFYDLFATIAAARRQKLSPPTSTRNSISLYSLSPSVYSVVILVITLLQGIAIF